MDILNIQSLISQEKVVGSNDVDPNNSYLVLGVWQDGNRKSGSANNAYPSYAIPLSELGGGGTWGSITGVLSNQLDLQAALNNKYDISNPAGYITLSALAPYLTSVDAALTYLTIANAASTYQPILGYTPEDAANKSIDGTLSANSDTLYSSQKAVKTYVDASVSGVLDDRGNWDASTNLFPTTGGSGPGGSILKGDLWFVSVPGILGGTPVVVGNNFRALVDNPTLSSDWNILNVGLGYIPENIANKGIANGYASLDANGIVPASQIKYKTLHRHGFNTTTIGSTAGARWTSFGSLIMLSNSAPFTSNPSYALAQRLAVIPKTGIIKSAKISYILTSGTSTQNHILTFRNNTTSTTNIVTSTFQIGASTSLPKTFIVSGLNIAVTENDIVHSVIESPTIIGTVLSGVSMTIDYIIE